MGTIANDIIEGYCCALCGVYFEEPHDYPVVCKDCYSTLNDNEKKEYQCATKKEL